MEKNACTSFEKNFENKTVPVYIVPMAESGRWILCGRPGPRPPASYRLMFRKFNIGMLLLYFVSRLVLFGIQSSKRIHRSLIKAGLSILHQYLSVSVHCQCRWTMTGTTTIGIRIMTTVLMIYVYIYIQKL